MTERGFGITADSNEVSLSLDETEGFLVGFQCDRDLSIVKSPNIWVCCLSSERGEGDTLTCGVIVYAESPEESSLVLAASSP